MSSSIPSASTPVKRACDSCHRRKVKCIGEGTNPCKNCQSAGLACTYNAIPQKKGPKGSRAKVLSELRETQRQSQLAPGVGYDTASMSQRSMSPTTTPRAPGILTNDLVGLCAEFYLTNLYPSQPLLQRQRIQEAFMVMDQSVELYVMLSSLCAHVMLQPNFVLPPNVRLGLDYPQSSATNLGQYLLEEANRVRKSYDFFEAPTLDTIYTSYFMFCAFSTLSKHDAAWYFLRDALTMAHILRLHDEESYKGADFMTISRRRRMFWVLFIAERNFTFKKDRPLTLSATIQPPSAEEDPAEHVNLIPFVHNIKLYRPFDETFFGLWYKTKSGVLPTWLIQMQTHLTSSLPSFLEGSPVQIIDLRITQLWLKTMVWQLSITHGYISTMPQDATLSFRYPIELSRDLVQLSSEYPESAMKAHGISTIEKLFDIACTLLDVITYTPMTPEAYEAEPQEYLTRIILLINSLRGDRTRFMSMLAAKVAETLPNYQLPILIQRPGYVSRSSTATTPTPGEGAPFDTTSPYGSVRQANILQSSPSLQYPNQGVYPAYSSSINYGDATSAMPAGNMYQTHMPPGARGYPS